MLEKISMRLADGVKKEKEMQSGLGGGTFTGKAHGSMKPADCSTEAKPNDLASQLPSMCGNYHIYKWCGTTVLSFGAHFKVGESMTSMIV